MELMITKDLALSSVTTLAQCEAAELILVNAISQIKGDLERTDKSEQWRRDATRALKLKNWMLSQVQQRRKNVNQRALVLFQQKHPDLYEQLCKEAA